MTAGVVCRECKRAAGSNPDCSSCLAYNRPIERAPTDLSRPVIHWPASITNR